MAHAAQVAVLLGPLGNPRISARSAHDSVLPSVNRPQAPRNMIMCETSFFLSLLIQTPKLCLYGHLILIMIIDTHSAHLVIGEEIFAFAPLFCCSVLEPVPVTVTLGPLLAPTWQPNVSRSWFLTFEGSCPLSFKDIWRPLS